MQQIISQTLKETPSVLIGFAMIVLASIFVGIAADMWYLAGLPIVFLVAYQTIIDFRKIFLLLLLSIPLSTEIYLPSGLGTDLPTEPLIVGLMLTYLVYVLRNPSKIRGAILRHPLVLLILLHFGWLVITMIFSSAFVISMKFVIAKFWYLATFLFLGLEIFREEKDVKILFWYVFIPLLFTICTALVRQYQYDFAFDQIHMSMSPFFRNHVSYGAVLALFVPYIWCAITWQKRWSLIWFGLIASFFIFLIAIQFSYTRTAYVALMLAFGAYVVIRLKLVRYGVGAGMIVIIAASIYVVHNNTYLDYAPNYKKTISHQKFDDLLEATYKMEDISTMERVHRWVAALHMSDKKPLLGFGPGSFYTFYKGYTVYSFETYVSDNPEKSGVHSYFLMTLVEQGFIGLFIFMLLTCAILIKGEIIYHQTPKQSMKNIVMMVLLSIVVIDAFLLINDMIETDKVGSFYFMNIAILINIDLANQRRTKELSD